MWAMRLGEPAEASSIDRVVPFCLLGAAERSIMDVGEGCLLRVAGKVRRVGLGQIGLRRDGCDGDVHARSSRIHVSGRRGVWACDARVQQR